MTMSRRAGTVLAVVAVLATVLVTPAVAHRTGAYSHDASIGAWHPRWMSRLPDTTRLSGLTLPGTHDSGAYRTPANVAAVTQTMDLRTQLDSGIRAWDIRLAVSGDSLTVYHGPVRQGQDFDTDVLGTADAFLSANPTETVVMRVRNEHASDENAVDFERVVRSVLDRHPRVFHGEDNPMLMGLRGRILILQDFERPSGSDYGTPYRASWISTQDRWELGTNWDLAGKWHAIRNHLDAAATGSQDRLFINFLSGSTGALPYFVASGHSSPETGAPNLLTGWTRGVIDTCRLSSRCLDEYRDVNCALGTCSVAFEGTNVMTVDYAARFAKPSRYGIVYADFPGPSLVETLIEANDFSAMLVAVHAQRCVDDPGSNHAEGTVMVLWDCHDGPNQTWLIGPAGRVRLIGTELCLQPRGGSGADDTPVQIATCSQSVTTQLWSTDTRRGTVINTATGKCLEPQDQNTANGTPLVIHTCDPLRPGQLWARS
jgi:1-phosphatidylinositol phosphodiesterase